MRSKRDNLRVGRRTPNSLNETRMGSKREGTLKRDRGTCDEIGVVAARIKYDSSQAYSSDILGFL